MRGLEIQYGDGHTIRDVSDLDDKEFVRKRRIRNRTVSFMYWNFFIGFTVSMYLISDILMFILNN